MYNSAEGRAVIGRVAHDFYRCDRCRRLVTQPEMVRALGPDGTGSACPCGGVKYRPTNLTARERLLPRVWAFAWARAWELGPAGIGANLRADWARRRGGAIEEPYLPPPPGLGR